MDEQSFKIEQNSRMPDGEGGWITGWLEVPNLSITGYLDLITGSNQSKHIHNAQLEESTHILIVPEFKDGITDKMRVVDSKNRAYQITYVDDPVGIGHHLEIYLKFSEVLDNG